VAAVVAVVLPVVPGAVVVAVVLPVVAGEAVVVVVAPPPQPAKATTERRSSAIKTIRMMGIRDDAEVRVLMVAATSYPSLDLWSPGR
jgi:hypothetical protein